MKFSRIFTWILNLVVVMALPMQKRSSLNEHAPSPVSRIGCMHMESFPGRYSFVSDGSGSVCGLYLISLPDKLIELEFMDFDVGCQEGGLVALVDGWEMGGQFFPPPNDHHLNLEQRYMTYCGLRKPRKVLLSSQNVLLIQNRIPAPGQGFTVKVTFVDNPQPCNAVSMFNQGIYTMKNYGQRRNCSLSIINSEVVHLASVDVGVSAEVNGVESNIGLSHQCVDMQGNEDYVEVNGGNGFETDPSNERARVCGMTTGAESHGIAVGCSNTVIRLVSSGHFFNTVTFAYTQLMDPLLDDGTC